MRARRRPGSGRPTIPVPTPVTLDPAGPLGPIGPAPSTRPKKGKVRFESNTGSLWRGGRLILTGRVHSSVQTSGKAPARATIQIRRHGRWYTVSHVRLDPRGRFLTRPHLRRAGGARSGSHSR